MKYCPWKTVNRKRFPVKPYRNAPSFATRICFEEKFPGKGYDVVFFYSAYFHPFHILGDVKLYGETMQRLREAVENEPTMENTPFSSRGMKNETKSQE